MVRLKKNTRINIPWYRTFGTYTFRTAPQPYTCSPVYLCTIIILYRYMQRNNSPRISYTYVE